MSYADITTADPNRMKRWLQNRRLDDALWYVSRRRQRSNHSVFSFMDFGAGDGTLCRRVAERRPSWQVTCYEPASGLRRQAEQVLQGTTVTCVGGVPAGQYFDLISACEVFEHLTEGTTASALSEIRGALDASGLLVIGVPNEIFAVGLVKGLFRMMRRYGEYDASWKTVRPAALGRPRKDRPVATLDGLPFIYPHTGFDYRDLRRKLVDQNFVLIAQYGSPFRRLPAAVNSEVYMVCAKASG